MNIEYLEPEQQRFFYKKNHSADSPAIYISKGIDKFTCLVSDIRNGNIIIKYSLSKSSAVKNDTAIWHDWSLAQVTVNTGISFDSPVSFVRAVASASNVSYILEIMG